MNKIYFTFIALAASLVLLCGSASVDATDVASPVVELSPPGPSSWASFRNGHLQQGIASSALPEKLELLWKYSTEEGVVATAAIVGPHVYVGTVAGKLLCLTRKTGKLVWSYRSIDNPDPKKFAPSFTAAPTVTAGTVYIGDDDGVMHAVVRATGKKKWSFQTGGQIAGGAAVVGDHVIVGSHDGSLYCFNRSDGTVNWKFQAQDRVNCSPAIVGKYTFLAGCDEFLRVIDIETGKEVRNVHLSYIVASPAVYDNMLYVGTHGGSNGGEVLALDWQKGEILWRYKDPNRTAAYQASAAVTKNLVVAGGNDRQVHAIDRKTGKMFWKFGTRGAIDSSPVIAGNRVFVGSNDRNIYGLSLKDGKQVWKYNARGRVTASPAIGEGCLVIGSASDKGNIFCFGKKEN